MTEQLIYLDHAATSWPKPPEVLEAMQKAMLEAGANPGRGSHRMAVNASRTIFQTRRLLAELFHIPNPNDIAFTYNTTHALNMAIHGVLKDGDHVITTMLEHNSVRRPLEYLKKNAGIEVDYVEVDMELDEELLLGQLRNAFRPNTRLFICSHSSNLLGTILPIQLIAELAHSKGALLLVDAAQSAGVLPIDIQASCIDLLAFPGHKSLMGPQGTGGLYIGPHVDLAPYMHGGTGSQSEEPEQPKVRPDRYEAGTPNTVGIAGLGAGVTKVMEWTLAAIYQKEWQLTQYIIEQLQEFKGIRILGPELGSPRTGIVSFVTEQMDPSVMAFRMDREFNIAVRSGFHCTPLAHLSSHTMASGAVRASVGYHTTKQEVQALVDAVDTLIHSS